MTTLVLSLGFTGCFLVGLLALSAGEYRLMGMYWGLAAALFVIIWSQTEGK